MVLRKWILPFTLFAALTTWVIAQDKGGEDETGPYDVMENWPRPLHNDGWSWGSTPSVFAESADRVYVFQRGELPVTVLGATLEKESRYTTPGATNPVPSSVKPRWEHVLMVFDSKGSLVESWEQHNALFVNPHRVLMNPFDPERHVWLVDNGTHQVFKFTHDGKKLVMVLGEKGVPGLDQTHFNQPTDIAWLPSGEFYVTDGYGNSRVMKFSKEGKYLFEWGKPGKGPGEFNLPHSIAIDARQRIYVADRSNSRIQIFDDKGKFLDEWRNIRSPYYVYVSKDQHLWVSDGESHKMLKYTLDGKLVYSWGTFGAFPGGIWGSHQFSVDNEGNLYIADVFNRRVQKFRPKANADPAKLVTYSSTSQ